ncbi:hypothetical protein L914_03689 [Phytophthora nicotianae]|uniref:Uncharacterized protein n=1 Tax=Phytophthora nicotianae TaxID=4792 RepID=W2NW63_PHYNI|nr:hypothetical protein L914_03689 [Phytophthora nicotianae]
MKTMMNLNSTFDKCLSAILLYQVQVLRALKSDLILVDSKSHFYPNDPHALQHVSSVLSSYAYGLVRDQNQLFGTSCSSAKAVPTRLLESEWSIALYTRFLCSHIVFAVLVVAKLSYLPRSLILSRWNYAAAARCLVPALQTTITAIRDKALLTLETRRAETSGESTGTRVTPNQPILRTNYARLSRGEVCSKALVVQSDTEKYNIVTASLQPIINAMVNSSSVTFFRKMNALTDAIAVLLPELENSIKEFPLSSRSNPLVDAAGVLSNTSCSSDVANGPTQHSDIIQGAKKSPQRTVGNSAGTQQEVLAGVERTSNDVSGQTTLVRKHILADSLPRSADRITLPSNIQQGQQRRRSSTKKLRHLRRKVELLVEQWGEAVGISFVVEWPRHTNNTRKAKFLLQNYPQVIMSMKDQCRTITERDL